MGTEWECDLPSCFFSRRLKSKVENGLLDCFMKALELLCSPELVMKVRKILYYID